MNKKGFITIGLLISMTVITPFAASGVVNFAAQDQMYESVQTAPEKDSALVLGAAAYPSRLSDILQDRMDTAIELYDLGKVQRLIVSGGQNEASSMAEYAVENGVLETDVVQDPNGINTIASFKNTEPGQSLIVVTQEYHLPRALFVAGHFDFEAVGVIADKQPYADMKQYRQREFLAISKMFWDLYVAN